MPNPQTALASAIAACAFVLTAAAALPVHPASAFSLDLTPLHRISTEPTLQAGTYAAADPHPSHRRTHSSDRHSAHHTL